MSFQGCHSRFHWKTPSLLPGWTQVPIFLEVSAWPVSSWVSNQALQLQKGLTCTEKFLLSSAEISIPSLFQWSLPVIHRACDSAAVARNSLLIRGKVALDDDINWILLTSNHTSQKCFNAELVKSFFTEAFLSFFDSLHCAGTHYVDHFGLPLWFHFLGNLQTLVADTAFLCPVDHLTPTPLQHITNLCVSP